MSKRLCSASASESDRVRPAMEILYGDALFDALGLKESERPGKRPRLETLSKNVRGDKLTDVVLKAFGSGNSEIESSETDLAMSSNIPEGNSELECSETTDLEMPSETDLAMPSVATDYEKYSKSELIKLLYITKTLYVLKKLDKKLSILKQKLAIQLKNKIVYSEALRKEFAELQCRFRNNYSVRFPILMLPTLELQLRAIRDWCIATSAKLDAFIEDPVWRNGDSNIHCFFIDVFIDTFCVYMQKAENLLFKD
uniref:ORF11 n=1 Tax=Lymantria dispar multicapsid nuclear polyhedrosis virus TaxID=10449 RepID=A0A2S1XBG9_NPVLD|nr:ORF11 [Lymantria dispar multiple nucleopolyhedrovirus]